MRSTKVARLIERKVFLSLIFVLLFGICTNISWSVEQSSGTRSTFDEALYKAMKWRSIGPYRGGRVTAVTGIPPLPPTPRRRPGRHPTRAEPGLYRPLYPRRPGL